jgi:hypothetical protein
MDAGRKPSHLVQGRLAIPAAAAMNTMTLRISPISHALEVRFLDFALLTNLSPSMNTGDS